MLSAKKTGVELDTTMKRAKKGEEWTEGGIKDSRSRQNLHPKMLAKVRQLRHFGEDNLRRTKLNIIKNRGSGKERLE